MLLRIRKPLPQGDSKMGPTHVAVRLFNSESQTAYHDDFLVDTGAMDTMAPACALRKIGVKPIGKDEYEMANGDVVEFEHGNVEMEFMGEVIPTRILVGPDHSDPIL